MSAKSVLHPTNSEEYTSFVISASPIAITGGNSDHSVPLASVIGAAIIQHTVKATMSNPNTALLR